MGKPLNLNTPYWQASMAQMKKEQDALAASGYASNQFYNPANFHLPYPGAPHDGSPQDLANTKYTTQNLENANKVDYINSNKLGFMDKLGMMVGLAPLAAIGGGVLAPALSGAVSGGIGGAVLGGAGAGAFTGAANAALTGGNIGKNLLTGALTGGVGGGIAASGIGQSLNGSLGNLGLNPSLAAGVTKGAIGAGTSALGAGLGGSNVGSAALLGGVGGFINGAVSNATGSGSLGSIASKIGGSELSSALASGGGHHNATPGGSNGSGINYLGAGALGAGAMMSGGQGNNGNMAGTDTSLASTITGALPGVLQSAAGVYGSQNAAEKQTQADQHAIDTQNTNLGNINNIWKTQQGLGQGAQTALGSALGTNGQPADYSGFENMPGYKFAVQQGTQAIQRQAASMGNAYTPNTAQAVGQYVTGTAMQDYNTYINQLMGAAGLGNDANKGLQTGQQSNAENVGQLQVNQGHAQASGVSGASNAVGGAFSPNGVGTSLIGAAGNYLFGNKGGGSGGNGSGGNGSGGSGGGILSSIGSGISKMFGGGSPSYAGMNPEMFGGGDGSPNVSLNSNYEGSNGVGYSDPSQMTGDIGWGAMPDASAGTSTDFGGGLDYGASSSNDIYNGGTDFLGAW